MKIFKFTIIFLSTLVIIAVIGIYYFLYSALPKLLNTQRVQNEIENIINEKTGAHFKLTDFSVKANPKLVYFFSAKHVHMQNKEDEDLLDADSVVIKFSLLKFMLKDLNIDYIFVNESGLKNIIKHEKNKKTSDYKIKNLPSVNINKAEIWADNGEKGKVFILASNIKLTNEKNKKTQCHFDAEIVSNTLKNTLNIGREGFLYIKDKALYAQNIEILMGINSLYVNGKLFDDDKDFNFSVKGNNLPVNDIEQSLLYFLKLKKPGKQFLENFKDFNGQIDVDLEFKDKGIYGQCTAKELEAKSVLFDVPIKFPKAVFNFNNRTIKSEQFGTFGSEKVYTSFIMDKLLTDEQIVTGEVKSSLTEKFASKYVPLLSIKKSVDAGIKYKIKNRKIDVEYLALLEPGSDIIFKNAFLGLENFSRRLYVYTHKNGDKLTINSYDYSVKYNDNYKKIVLGGGLFEKINGHLNLKYLTFKTNGYAPFSATGYISKFLSGGYFDGDLKYDYLDNKITGNFKIADASYKNFYIKEAVINAKEENLSVKTQGTYNNSLYQCDINMVNKFDNNIVINSMDLFLDKYIVNNNIKKAPVNKIDIVKTAKDFDVTIKKWNIKVNEIRRNKIVLKSINLTGSLVNNIFKFTMPHAGFANGILKAQGEYNFLNKSSKVNFFADNIDSNIVADTVFNLPNQIHGFASASLYADTKNNFDDIKAHADFCIKEGYLLKLGDFKFLVKTSKKTKRSFKIRLQDIVNIDMSHTKALSSDIDGSFDYDNNVLKNVVITSKQKYLAMLIEGEYNINEQNADLKLWGKYNKKAQRGIRILFIPISWIINIVLRPEHTFDLYKDKLEKIPEIVSAPKDNVYFRVKVNGDLNNNNLKIELKKIK